MKSIVFLVLFYLCALIGCRKKETSGNNFSAATGKLKRITEVGTNLSIDNKFFSDFSYDNQDRVSNIVQYAKTPNGDSLFDCSINFFYTQSNLLPDKIFQDGSSNYWHYLTYDVNNRLIKDSCVKVINPTNLIDSVTFQYFGNTRIGYYGTMIANALEAKDSMVILNENSSFNKVYWDINNPYSNDFGVEEYLNFDGRKNPLYFLNIGKIYYGTWIHNTANFVFIHYFGYTYSKNNLMMSKTYGSYAPGIIYNNAYAYTYTNDDFPTKKLSYASGNLILTTEYFYY